MNRRAVLGMGAAIAVAAGAGCTSDFSLPDDAKIRCETDDQCPPESVCKTVLGRCVDSKAETTAPEVTFKKVTPGAARREAVIRVELTVSEPLDRDPVVRFSEPADAKAFALQHLGEAEGGGERYLGLYTASDADAQEGAAPVTREVVALQLIDRVGNVNPSASLGSVTFDYTAPKSPAVAIVQSPRASSSKVSVTLSAEGADYVLLGGDLASPGNWEPFVASKEVELVAGEGARSVQARFKDEAGNETADVRATTVVDTLAPTGTLEIALQDGRSAAASNALVRVDGTASADAELDSAAVVTRDAQGGELGRVPAAGAQLVDGILSGSVNVGTLPAGTLSLVLEVSVTDRATSTKLTSNALAVDDAAPTGLTLAFASASPSPAFTASATVPVKLGVSNVGRGDTSDLEMLFDPSGLAPTEPSRGLWVPFAAERTLQLDGAADGSKTVQVQVRDGAHNPVGPATATITLDTKPPTQPGVWISGRPTDVGSSLVTLELSCLDAAQVLVAGDVEAVAGATFEWVDIPADGKLVVQLSGATGSKVVTAVYRDRAGNPTAMVWYPVTLTSGRPPSLPTLAAPAGQTRVKWDDALAIGGTSIPNAVLESARLVFTDASGQLVGQKSLVAGSDVLLDLATGNFSGQVTLTEAATPVSAASVAVEAIVRRSAGTCPDDCSAGTESRSEPLKIDRHGPEAPALLVVQGTDVSEAKVDVLLSDPVDADSQDFQIRLEGTGVANATPAGTWLAFAESVSVDLTAGEGTKIIDVLYRDEADHRVKGQATVNFDTSAPQVTSVSLQGGGGKAGKTNSWTVQLTVSASGGPTQLRVSGAGVSPGAYSDWMDYAFGTATPIALTAGDGTKTVTVECRDAAGNADADSSASIVVDTTPADLAVDLQVGDAALGKTHVHSNDTGTLRVGGSANEAGCTFLLARLMGRSASGLTALKTLAQGSEVVLDPATGALSGSFTLAGLDLSAYSAVALEVGVADELGNPTRGGFVVSNEVPVDLTGPLGIALAKAAGQADPTREKSFQVRASSTDPGPVWVCFFGADLVAGAAACDSASAAFIPLQSGALTQTLALVGKQGANTVSARFRDRSFLTVDQTLPLTFDAVPPALTSLSFKADATTKALPDGTMASWHGLGSVTLLARFDALPASLAISGDFDKASIPGCTGAECAVRFTTCAGGVCEATLRLTATPVDGSHACSDPPYALGDGVKLLSVRPVDDAGNAGAATATRILLDRTCPTQLVLDSRTAPQITTFGTEPTKYVTSNSLSFFVQTPSTDEDLVGYQTRLNGGPWQLRNPSDTSFGFTLLEGVNTLEIEPIDIAGLTGADPASTFTITVDTARPTAPVAASDGPVFNGERMTVLLASKSTDVGPDRDGEPTGDPTGATLTYEVLGGPYHDGAWHPVGMCGGACSDWAGALPFLEIYPDASYPGWQFPQQQSVVLYVRARDKAGNASDTALVTAFEQSTWNVHATGGLVADASPGLWGDHLAFREHPRGVATEHVYYQRLPDGPVHDLWSASIGAGSEEVQAKGRTIVWEGRSGTGTSLFFYDLGADQVFGTGDETAYASNPLPAVAIDYCPEDSAFDFDPVRGEVAFIKGETSACSTVGGNLSVYVADTKTLAVQKACVDCISNTTSGAQVSLSGGCMVYNTTASTVAKRCAGTDGKWGTSDDVVTTLSGACNRSFRFLDTRRLSLGKLAGETAVAWVQDDGSGGNDVCVWRESTGTSAVVYQQPRDISHAVLSGTELFFLARQPDTSVAAFRFTPADGTAPIEAIAPGALSSLAAWTGDVAVSRSVEGGQTQLEYYQSLDEQPLSAGNGQRSPSIDGDRVVWVDTSAHPCGEIMMLDRTKKAVRQLTTTDCPATSTYPVKLCPKISGTHVVWQVLTGLRKDEQPCEGQLFGLADASAASLSAAVEISASLTGASQPSARVAVSGDYVVFDNSTANLFLYRWSVGTLPVNASPLVAKAMEPALDGNRLVFLGAWDAANPSRYYAVRTCTVGSDCNSPQTIVPNYPGGACIASTNYCYWKHSPRVRGSRVVWFDNRAAATDLANYVNYQVYEAPVSGVGVAGTQVSTSPVRGLKNAGLPYPDLWVQLGMITPELGPDFVVTTSVRANLDANAGGSTAWADYTAREVALIALTGPDAYVERVFTRSDGRQTSPATDASGNIVWQDHRGGAGFQVLQLER